MTKKLLALGMSIVMTAGSLSGYEVSAKDSFNSLNQVIDVGDKLYVQHDENNKDIYDLKKSGTGETTVYEQVFPTFTANKAWTTSGEYVDNLDTRPYSATAPEDYIPVSEGEQYFVRIYGVGHTKVNIDGVESVIWYAPILFFDANDSLISHELTNTVSASKQGVLITVPDNATKMHITMFNNQSFTLHKVLNLSDEEFDSLPIHRSKLEEDISSKYNEYQKDKTVYKKLNKGYVTFVNDDTRDDIEEYADLFKEKNIPLVLATVPELLIENATSQTKTRLDVARQVVADGGEIIAHNGGVLKQEGFSDYNTMYSFFVRTKQMFNHYGFDVNGIILAGGQGQVVGAQETERWASSIYSYSDLYGVKYDNKDIALDSAYFHYRTGLVNYANNLDRMKQEVDNAIANNQWVVFYFHNEKDIQSETLSQLLDYVNTKNVDELEVVTYKEMYEKNAVKESELGNSGGNTSKTYYISSDGTSLNGTREDAPMSYETAKNLTYYGGDKILFKCGDTFYGTFDPKIVQRDANNIKTVTISSYGEGDMPTISGYKITDSAEDWIHHPDNWYKVKLLDSKSTTGVTAVDSITNNIGFLEDANGVKYSSKSSKLSISNKYDFYCDGQYLYMKTDVNPYTELGVLKLATKTPLLILHSNMKVENLRFCGTGAHAMVGSDETTENVEIVNNVIEDIGGSYLKDDIRYGNGIEFYETNAINIKVHNNIIRNVYDVGFTIQGNKGSGSNVIVCDNIFVGNSQDSEIWEGGNATGVVGYEFTNNISINSGRGWGYDARPEKYASAHILFWQYLIENTDIYFHHNKVYNPRRIYFFENGGGTSTFFKDTDYIKSDYNNYFLSEDTTLFRDDYTVSDKDKFIADYGVDEHSVFTVIEEDTKLSELSNLAMTSSSIKDINKLFIETVGSDILIDQDITGVPSKTPTQIVSPTNEPTKEPTQIVSPTNEPTKEPTQIVSPTNEPTKEPTQIVSPTNEPTKTPTKIPTNKPTKTPTETPTKTPTKIPTNKPTKTPTEAPTKTPTETPTKEPIKTPTVTAIITPIEEPTKTPTKEPTKEPTTHPTVTATITPTAIPTDEPTVTPTDVPVVSPTQEPTVTSIPTSVPTVTSIPTNKPTEVPTKTPISIPTISPTSVPTVTSVPTTVPSVIVKPTSNPEGSGGNVPTKPTITSKPSVSIEEPVKGTKIKLKGIVYEVVRPISKGATVKVKGLENKKITSVKIPNSIKYKGKSYKVEIIGSKAFAGTKIKKVSIGKNVKNIESKAFYKCTKLTKVTGGKNVQTIGNEAFSCSKINSITINSKVTKIGKKAFYKCSSLKKVTIKTKKLKKSTIGVKAFSKINKKAKFKVPKSKIKSYTKILSL